MDAIKELRDWFTTGTSTPFFLYVISALIIWNWDTTYTLIYSEMKVDEIISHVKSEWQCCSGSYYLPKCEDFWAPVTIGIIAAGVSPWIKSGMSIWAGIPLTSMKIREAKKMQDLERIRLDTAQLATEGSNLTSLTKKNKDLQDKLDEAGKQYIDIQAEFAKLHAKHEAIKDGRNVAEPYPKGLVELMVDRYFRNFSTYISQSVLVENLDKLRAHFESLPNEFDRSLLDQILEEIKRIKPGSVVKSIEETQPSLLARIREADQQYFTAIEF